MGKYSVIVEKSAQKELQGIYKSGDKASIKKIEQIFEDLIQHPEMGTGKPEPLKHQLSGMWSRRINREDRMVYEVIENTVIIHSVKGHYK